MATMVGFDVAKKTVVGAIVDTNYHTVVLPLTLDNSEATLRGWLAVRQNQYPDIAVCCESTSYYHYPVIRACVSLGIACQVLNPIVTKQATKATVRGKKTDASDAVLIAKLGLRGEGVVTTAVGSDAKVLLRASDKLQGIRHSLASLRTSLDERAVTAPPETGDQYDRLVAGLDALVAAYRQAVIRQTESELCRLLTSIPGIGDKTAAMLAAELEDVCRFGSLDKLVAYAGLDPRVRQSGTSLHRNTRLTKRGSPYLRRAIFLAANVARRYDPDIRAYYEKKRAEGRTYTEAMIPVCRKLLARVYAVWKRRTRYEKQRTA